MSTISRRDFLIYTGGGIAVLVVGGKVGSWALSNLANIGNSAQAVELEIGDAVKEMHTHNPTNSARCYFWVYKSVSPDLSHDSPGPVIITTRGDTVNLKVTNKLDEPHAFFIPGMVDSGPIAPGETWQSSFVASISGAHLYFDNLNSPVNRVMGLHGALIVMPDAPQPGHKFTPYDNPTPAVQKLFDDLGSTAHFPGLAWEQGDSTPWALDSTGKTPNAPPFRQYVWLAHQASPRLFAEVGDFAEGEDFPANRFVELFLRDPFQPHAFHADNPEGNRRAQYFTFSGQSGFFSHDSAVITPMGRVGEPAVVHILNAGLWAHSLHLHANHFYVTSVNGEVRANVFSLDTFEVGPADRVDYLLPFTRPPDVPNVRGLGLPDTPLTRANGRPVWPPVEEMDLHLPRTGTMAKDRFGNDIDLAARLSPLCYPMHDHSEPTQTSQGGNYNTGVISGIYFTGDRNTPGSLDFPMDRDFHFMFQNVRGVSVAPPAALPAAPPPRPLP